MPNCPILKNCPFFNNKLSNITPVLKTYKLKCCLDDNLGCARFIIARFLGVHFIPHDLLPNEMDKAENIINNHWNKPRRLSF